MSQERLKVLEMLSAGTIDAGQAAELLKNLSTPVPAAPPEPIEADSPPDFADEIAELKAEIADDLPDDADDIRIEAIDIEEDSAENSFRTDETAGPKKRLRIEIADGKSTDARVKLSIPFGLLKFGLSIGEQFAPKISGFDWDNLNIDIEDGDSRVHIYVE